MIKKIKLFGLIILLSSSFLLTSPFPALGANCDVTGVSWLKSIGVPDGLLIPCECLTSKKSSDGTNAKVACDLNSAFQTVVNFSKLILAVTGSAALLMFIYGGLMFILAAGNQERIQQGKTALAAAAIGLAIILGAWLIVNTTILVLSSGKVGGEATIFGNKWYNPNQ